MRPSQNSRSWYALPSLLLVIPLLTGCESMTDQQVAGLLLGGLSPFSASPQVGQSMAYAGSSLVSADNADRSRTQININQERPSQQGSSSLVRIDEGLRLFHDGEAGSMHVMTANFIKDFNKDGIYSRDEGECVGLKEKFSRYEKITLLVGSHDPIPSLLYKFVIYAPDGNEFKVRHLEINTTEAFETYGPKEANGMLNTGKYTVVLYNRGEYIGRSGFEVTE